MSQISNNPLAVSFERARAAALAVFGVSRRVYKNGRTFFAIARRDS